MEEPLIYDAVKTLDLAFDLERMKAQLQPLARRRFGGGVEIVAIEPTILRRRCKRCVLRYGIRLRDGAGAEIDWPLIAKVFGPEPGDKVFDNMRQLWENGFSREAADGISIPEPLAFLPDERMLLQEEVPGTSLSDWIRQGASRDHFLEAARALAKLHLCPLVLRRPFRVQNHLLRCHPKHEFLALALPELASVIEEIVDTAYRIEIALGQVELTPLHGDFHLSQVLIRDDRTWLIDFDALSCGDPASDLGNLMVFMKGKLRRKPELEPHIQAFLEEYLRLAGRGAESRVPLYEGLTHLRRACKCLRFQQPGWEERATRMVHAGSAAIAEMARQTLEAVPGFDDLRVGQRIKVKVRGAAEGELRALEITPKPAATAPAIEAVIQGVDPSQRTVRLLERDFPLPEAPTVGNGLSVGSLVRLTGTARPDTGFVARQVTHCETRNFNLEKLWGPIEAIDSERRALRMLGFTVWVDPRTTIETHAE